MQTTIEIEKLLPWSAPKEIDTKAGRKILRKAKPTENFWATWRSNKEALKAAGLSCGQYQGQWECCWWQSPDPVKAAAEAQAKQAAIEQRKIRAVEAQLTPEQETRFAARKTAAPRQLSEKCSDDFSAKGLICLHSTLDSAQAGLVRRFRGSNHIDTIHQPRPEERALARVSKDGHKRGRASGHPSRRAPRGALLWMRSVGSEFRPSDLIGFMESIH